MIVLLTLRTTHEALEQEIVRWFQATRQAAVEVQGVYDLAFYNSDAPTESGLCCLLDVEDEQSLSAFWQNQQIQKALKRGKALGLELVAQVRWHRLA